MPKDELRELVRPSVAALAQEIAERVMDLNGKLPSAVFLAGGGCKMDGLREEVASALKIDPVRVTVAGNHFQRSAFSEDYDLNDPEYATPLGIAISAGLGLINDSYVILLNGEPAKLFRSGVLLVRDILMMNGYGYPEMMGKSGSNLSFTLNGERKLIRGAMPVPPVLLLNGALAGMTDVVRAGDKLEFTPARAGADAVKRVHDLLPEDFQGTVTVNGATAAMNDLIHTGDDVWIDEQHDEPVSAVQPSGTAAPSAANAPDSPESSATAAPGAAQLRVVLNGENMILFGKANGEPYYLMDLLQYSGIDFDRPEKPVELFVNGEPCGFSTPVHDGDNVKIG